MLTGHLGTALVIESAVDMCGANKGALEEDDEVQECMRKKQTSSRQQDVTKIAVFRCSCRPILLRRELCRPQQQVRHPGWLLQSALLP